MGTSVGATTGVGYGEGAHGSSPKARMGYDKLLSPSRPHMKLWWLLLFLCMAMLVSASVVSLVLFSVDGGVSDLFIGLGLLLAAGGLRWLSIIVDSNGS